MTRQSLHMEMGSKSDPLLHEDHVSGLEGFDVTTDHPTPPPTTSSSLFQSIVDYFITCVWPGMGLFGESYLLFSVGTLKPIWGELFDDVDDGIHSRISTLTVLGVMVGMMAFGMNAGILGRRRGSILTASIMAGGAVGLLCVSVVLVDHPRLLFQSISVLLFLFGIGVGGEYPLSASSASEKAMAELSRRQTLDQLNQIHFDTQLETVQPNRGRQVQLVFAMQGMGIWFQCVTMTILLWATGQIGGEYDLEKLLFVWRAIYAVAAIMLTGVLIGRVLYLEESKVWADDKRKREALTRIAPTKAAVTTVDHISIASGGDNGNRNGMMNISPGPVMDMIRTSSSVSSMSTPSVMVLDTDDAVLRPAPSRDGAEDAADSIWSLLVRNYGIRLLGASMAWMLWDVAFYGNKLFQSSFLLAITGEDDTTLLQFAIASTLNATVALLGYFGAAFLVDHPWVGRLHLQQVGFVITGILFVSCGFMFDSLGTTSLAILYLGSSFFGQLGPNATTFLLPAELFPTQLRTHCHGIAAASGKLGALLAAIGFGHLPGSASLFLVSGYCSFAAALVTFWTIPETMGLDLYELDKKWRMTLDGRKGEYEGDANHPKYLSYYERQKLGLQY